VLWHWPLYGEQKWPAHLLQHLRPGCPGLHPSSLISAMDSFVWFMSSLESCCKVILLAGSLFCATLTFPRLVAFAAGGWLCKLRPLPLKALTAASALPEACTEISAKLASKSVCVKTRMLHECE